MHDFGTQENFDQGRAAALVFDCSKKNIKMCTHNHMDAVLCFWIQMQMVNAGFTPCYKTGRA
jgi:hypothetical protein